MTANEASGRIAALAIYPVKSCGGIALEHAELGAMGLAHDRRWMIVEAESGRFLTQRELSGLATLRPAILAESLELALPDGTRLALPLDDQGEPCRVRVWRDEVQAVHPDAGASKALGRWLGREVRIVRFPASGRRPCDQAYAPAGSEVGFADGFPLLATSTSSLEALNGAIAANGGKPVPMRRFRPNIVIEGLPPGAEKVGARLEIEDGPTLALVKRCERCVITTIDQESGERTGKEPLSTLLRLRRAEGSGPWFGLNAVPLLPPGRTARISLAQTCRLVG